MMNLVYSSYDNALSAEYDRCETSPQARPRPLSNSHFKTWLCHKTEIQGDPQSQTSCFSQTYGCERRNAELYGFKAHAQRLRQKQSASVPYCKLHRLLLLRE